MTTLQQDPRFFELLKWAELADSGRLNPEAEHLLQGLFGFVEEMLHRSEPQTSVVDRFSWTGTSFVDGLQEKYGAPEMMAMGLDFQRIGTNFDRLFRLSDIGFETGYRFFDFESLVMPEVVWDVFDEDEAYEYAYTHAARKRSLFSTDRKASPRAAATRRPYPKRMGTAATTLLPQILQNIPARLAEPLRQEMMADWIDTSGMTGELVATPDIFEDIEQTPNFSGNVRTILNQAVLSNKGRANRIKDIKLQPHALPALNSALNAVRRIQRYQPGLAEQSVTSAVRYHPVDMAPQAGRDLFEGTLLEIPAEQRDPRTGAQDLAIRPMVPIQGFEDVAQRIQPESIRIEDIFLPSKTTPALTSGLIEAAHQLGIETPVPSAASRFSLAKAEAMLQGITLGVPIVQPVASDLGPGADLTFVEQELFDPTFETETVREKPVSLKTLLTGRVETPRRAETLPLEHQVMMKHILGSQLPMTLGHSKPVEQAQKTLAAPTLEAIGAAPLLEALALASQEATTAPSALLKDVGTGMIRLPEEMVARSELSKLTPDLLFQLVSQPEVAAALASGVGRDVSFWTRIQDRAESLDLSATDVADVWTLDASLVDLPSETYDGTTDEAAPEQTVVQTEAKSVQTVAASAITPAILREVLSRAAAKTGIRGNDLMPRMLREVGARTEPKAIGRAFRKMLEANEISTLMGSPETARQFSTALRRELRTSGIVDTTLLELPDIVAEAYPEAAPEALASDETTTTDSPVVVEASKEQMRTVQMAARMARRVGRAMQRLMTERYIGVPMSSIGWQGGPSLEALDSMVQRVLDMPLSQSGPEAAAGGPRTYRDLVASGDAGTGDFVQFSYDEAVEAGLMAEMEKGSKPSGAHVAPGISMGLSFSKVLSKQGQVSERLRTLLASVETEPGAIVDLSAVLGWNEREQIQQGQPDFDSFGSAGPILSGGGWGRDESMEPVRPPQPTVQAEAIPLGLIPSGTSMDLGRLSHTMLRPGEVTMHDMSLVSPVSVAVAQAAHLKETSEPIGETSKDKAEAESSDDDDGTKKEVPNEILELLSHQIAKRISTRMKFEQDRSGRWDF
jgi:hypothetical protein